MSSSSRPRSGRSAIDWLGLDPTLLNLTQAAQRLLALQSEVDVCLAPLRVQVISLEQGRLLLGAAHASAAARLRQSEPSLVRHLVSRGWPVSAVRFRPPRADHRPVSPTRAVKPAPLPSAVAELRRLAADTRHPELAQALARFTRRHPGGG